MRRVSRVLTVLSVAVFAGPALVAPAPAAQPTIGAFEALAAALLPANSLPTGAVDAIAYTVRLQPGGRVDFSGSSRPEGAVLEHVVAGAYALRSEGPVVVLRGGAAGPGLSAEEVDGGEE